MLEKKCTVIVVTYNGKKEWYNKCIQSLLSSSIPLNIIVIDNKSTDDSVSYITDKFPEVQLIQSGENLGFAKANNIGLNIAYNNSADYFFLLNQDAWVEHNTIETLIAVAEKEQEFGILSPIHLTANKNSFDDGFINYFYSYSDTINAYENLYLKKQEPILYKSRFVNAAAWLITRKCVETVGGFDTIMFKHYGEDYNYCQRVLFHNLKIGIVPSVTMCHDRANRINKPLDVFIGYASTWSNVYLTKNTLIKNLLRMFFESNVQEIFWLVKNLKKVTKSRKINKTAGKGLEYILEIKEK